MIHESFFTYYIYCFMSLTCFSMFFLSFSPDDYRRGLFRSFVDLFLSVHVACLVPLEDRKSVV